MIMSIMALSKGRYFFRSMEYREKRQYKHELTAAQVVDAATIKPEHVCKPPEAVGLTNFCVSIIRYSQPTPYGHYYSVIYTKCMLGFRVLLQGFGFRVYGLESRVHGLYKGLGLGFNWV